MPVVIIGYILCAYMYVMCYVDDVLYSSTLRTCTVPSIYAVTLFLGWAQPNIYVHVPGKVYALREMYI